MFKLVIIDDNTAGTDALTKTVDWAKIGCRVAGVAYDGNRGMELILREKPDVIISDIRMPSLDGLSMLEYTRQFLPDCRCVFISAFDDFKFAQRAVRLGAVDYLLKPFLDEELLKAVQKALPAGVPAECPENENARPALPDDAALSSSLAVERMIGYIRENLSEPLTLAKMSARFGFVPSYISSLIRKHTGRTFSALLTGERMAAACRLLTDPAIHIDEIAERTGYKNYVSFYKVFLRSQGVSPSAYRNGQRRKENP